LAQIFADTTIKVKVNTEEIHHDVWSGINGLWAATTGGQSTKYREFDAYKLLRICY